MVSQGTRYFPDRVLIGYRDTVHDAKGNSVNAHIRKNLSLKHSDSNTMKRFKPDDTAMILIDHQVGTIKWASTTPLALLQRNVLILARFAKGTGMPVVLTSSQETNVDAQGPLMPELEEAVPEAFAARVKREGVVNAWDDERFAEACRQTGRRNLVMAGVTTDVCMVSPAISALEEGYNVQVVCDACGSTNQIAEEMAWRRMERAGDTADLHERHGRGVGL